MGARYEISWSRDGGRRFQLKAPDGQVLLQSETYQTPAGCMNGIASCREHAPFDRFYVRGIAGSAQQAFQLKAANNRVLGQSMPCCSAELRESRIQAIKKYAPTAVIQDHTQ